MNLVQEGVNKSLVTFDNNGKYVVYRHQNKRRSYDDPEEKVQTETYLRLILTYKYPPDRIRVFSSVRMGSEAREADIVVFADDQLKSPFIIVECKKAEVSELEFSRAVDQAFSYAVAEGAKYVWVTSGLKNEYYEVTTKRPKERIAIPDVPQFGVKGLARFKFAKGGGQTKTGQKLFELDTVSEDELTRRFQQAHQALWGGGELNPSEAFDELDKLIFCKIWDERKARKVGEPYDFQIFTEETKEQTEKSLLKRIKDLYQEGRKRDPEVFKDDIRLGAAKVRTVVSYLEGINLSETDLDSKGRAFETFMGSFFRGDFGQYFTPRVIVKFIVDSLPITNESLVLDTSCGSGGFLLHALDKVRKSADEYFEQGSNKYYRYWHDFAMSNLYGIEINEQIARTAKMNMIIHDDGHTNVVTADGLLPADELREKSKNQGFKYSRFDFIITNPPFGSVVKQTEKAYMHQYRFAAREVDWLNPKSMTAQRPNQDTEILFIEQCHKYLREGGYLAIVIPDGILTNSSLQYVRDGIEELYRIVAVISLPQTAFAATGAGVKSSVLFLRKHPNDVTKKIRQMKQEIKDIIRKKHKLEEALLSLEEERKNVLKNLTGFKNETGLTGKELKQSEAYKVWAKNVSELYKEKVEEFRRRLSEIYVERKRKALEDYTIFMAIADDIGYDATGKPTRVNELEPIGHNLSRFIAAIDDGKE